MKIGELAAATDVAVSAIRYYEAEGLLPEPTRTAAGYRIYEDDAVARVRFVRRAQDAGLRLDEIRDVLAIRDEGQAPCGHVVGLLHGRLDQVRQQIAELEALRDQMQHLIDVAADDPAAQNTESDICWLIERAG